MTPQQEQDLLKVLPRHQVAGIFLYEEFTKYFADNPFDHDSYSNDLNPGLYLKSVCEIVSAKVRERGYECSVQDVMIYWLSRELYNKLPG